MTAVAGASGMRMWLEARVPLLAKPRVRTIARRTIIGLGVVAASVLGPSAHAPSTTPAGKAAAPPVAIAAAPVTATR